MLTLVAVVGSATLSACQTHTKEESNTKKADQSIDPQHKDSIIFSKPSVLKNNYIGFDAPKAINAIAAIENEYFNDIQDSYSRYYGTVWRQQAEVTYIDGHATSTFEKYRELVSKKGYKVDSMHCTIYAIEALKAGLGNTFAEVENHHKRIWRDREHAGWSIAHILTTYYNWSAYLIISKESKEYTVASKNFKKSKKYDVWKQPDIALEAMFILENDQVRINSLLAKHEFGWGFSDQGWHTWITRFDMLKECNWSGAPSREYQESWDKPLFLKTKFLEFYDYNSHIVVFPPLASSE
ncbi:hypothetical protein GCM10022393_34260 [Aquimarina addita]|uniref:Uncharacterized protein n=2 Tax=Aquimarina addita TaxID=870485 RepID=A0ABP6UPW9_9FLAO